MKVMLVYPPTSDLTAPYLSVPMLTGFLRGHGVEVVPVDANVEAYDFLLRRGPLYEMRSRIERRLGRLERKPMLRHTEQLAYAASWGALGDAYAVCDGIEEAVSILRDPVRFYEPEHYARAVDTLDASMQVISAAYTPLAVDFTAYRTPFSLTSLAEITHDAAEEWNPYHAYTADVLFARIASEAPDVVGISVCFPGQTQPAYSMAMAIKEAFPSIHLTVGGPSMTQMLIRQSGQVLAEALGPFDSGVVFEGEHTLLALLEIVEKYREDPMALTKAFGLQPNIVHRLPDGTGHYRKGSADIDMRTLPSPDYDGMPLSLYFSPHRVLPYDPTRGCYWGRCTFCHYGLSEVGTASYRERKVETCVEHLRVLSERYGTKTFYLSQDSVAPKTLVRFAEAMAEADLGIRWATDLKAEKYLTAERAEILRKGGAVACALGIESASPRVLGLIDKGAPVSVLGEVIERLSDADIAVEAMCFTEFPSETISEALDTLRFLEAHREDVAAFIVGQFDLTHGSLIAQTPEKFGLRETWQVEGDRFGVGLFYREQRPSKRGDDAERLDEALNDLSKGWWLRRYPWAGSLSTAHTLFYYLRFGKGALRELAGVEGGVIGARSTVRKAQYDLEVLEEAQERESEIWQALTHEQRRISREAYRELAQQSPSVTPSPQTYRLLAGHPPVLLHRRSTRARRPKHQPNALKQHR